jgi:hypothetical protein
MSQQSTRRMAEGDEPSKADDEIAGLRTRYEVVTGKRPFMGWSAKVLQFEIAKAEAAVAAESDKPYKADDNLAALIAKYEASGERIAERKKIADERWPSLAFPRGRWATLWGSGCAWQSCIF